MVQLPDKSRKRMSPNERANPTLLPSGSRIYRHQILLAAGRTESCIYPVNFSGKTYNPTANRSWSTNIEGMKRLIAAGRVTEVGNNLTYVRFGDDFPVNPLGNLWGDTASGVGSENRCKSKSRAASSTARFSKQRLLLSREGLARSRQEVEEGKTAYTARNDYRGEHDAHSCARGIRVHA